jgi:hypothetical protein
MVTTTPITSYPWQPQSTITGNLAIGNLRENLLKSLKTERGIHTETLLTAVGALAGFAAQNAALNQVTSPDPTLPKLSIAIALGRGGEKYVFGEAVNIYLYPEPKSTLPLGAIVAGAAVQAGVSPADLPNYNDIAKHFATVVGTPEFWRLRAPKDHQPHLPPLELLRKVWPLTHDVLRLPLPKGIPPDREPPLKEIHWPIIVSLVASQFIAMTKDILNPGIGAALVMESAVITSKVDPETIEPGKWRIDTSETGQAIIRLRN